MPLLQLLGIEYKQIISLEIYYLGIEYTQIVLYVYMLYVNTALVHELSNNLKVYATK